MHALLKVYGIEHLYLIACLKKDIPNLAQNLAFRISQDE